MATDATTTPVPVAAAPTADTLPTVTVGKNYLIYLNVGTASTAKWLKVGGQRSGGITRKADTIDASSKDSGGWKSTLQGFKEWSIDLETVVMPNDVAMAAIEQAFLSDQLINLKFEYPDSSYITGWASISELSISAPHDDVATYKGTLNGVGPLSELKKG